VLEKCGFFAKVFKIFRRCARRPRARSHLIFFFRFFKMTQFYYFYKEIFYFFLILTHFTGINKNVCFFQKSTKMPKNAKKHQKIAKN